MENINVPIREFKVLSNIDEFLFNLYSDHQTTPMMNGEHHSDKSNGCSSPMKVFLSLRFI
jgi:hypothetical protein